MFNASKLWKSSSISGPVAMVEARLAEQLLDAQPHLGDGMKATARFAATRQRDVDAFLGELGGDPRLLELQALLLDRRLDVLADAVDDRARLPCCSASASLPRVLSFSVSQPLLPSVRTRSSSSAESSVLDSMAPSVSARRASRSSGAFPLTSTSAAYAAAFSDLSRAALACLAIAAKPSGWFMARSASILRSMSMPACLRPLIRRL